MKKIILYSFFAFLLSITHSTAQDINQKATAGAKLICDCTKSALAKNGIDVIKLA